MTIQWTRGGNAGGTFLLGEIDVSYDRLVRLFGEPDPGSSDGKIDAEWVLTFPPQSTGVVRIRPSEEVIATIYNGADGTPVAEIRDWHIGGKRREALWLLEELISQQ